MQVALKLAFPALLYQTRYMGDPVVCVCDEPFYSPDLPVTYGAVKFVAKFMENCGG